MEERSKIQLCRTRKYLRLVWDGAESDIDLGEVEKS